MEKKKKSPAFQRTDQAIVRALINLLNEKTFEKNLGLRNKNGEYNLLAQLLSDNSHFPLRVSIFEGETKGSNLFSVREFGNNCLLYTLDEVL